MQSVIVIVEMLVRGLLVKRIIMQTVQYCKKIQLYSKYCPELVSSKDCVGTQITKHWHWFKNRPALNIKSGPANLETYLGGRPGSRACARRRSGLGQGLQGAE